MTDLSDSTKKMSETDIEIYDDGAFTVFLSRFGLYNARDKDGNGLCASVSKEDCVFWARNALFGPLPGVETIYNGTDSLK